MRSRLVALLVGIGLAAVICLPAQARADTDPIPTIEFLLAELLRPILDLLGRGVQVTPAPGVDPTAAVGCDPLDPVRCLLPFPNDFFTVADPATDTGRRVSFSLAAMPRNVAGKPIDPTEWNRNDGFSPGSMMLAYVLGIDLDKTGAPRITDPGQSIAVDGGGQPTSPIVIVNTKTGELHPFFAELDRNQGAAAPTDLVNVANPGVRTPPTLDAERLLILRPLRNFEEGTRYVVALRRLKDASGNEIAPGPVFQVLRDPLSVDPLQVTPRRAHYENDIFPVLAGAGIARGDLYLAWDFTVASQRNLAERVLHIRDQGFHALAGGAPQFAISSASDFSPAENADTARRVQGTVTVPNFLNLPGGSTGSSFNYVGTPDGNLPAQFPNGGTLTATFTCNLSRAAFDPLNGGLPSVYGHGLLGSQGEVNSGHAQHMANAGKLVMCATDWIGLATDDLPTVATILADISSFPKLADRSQQGFLNFMFLGRAMIHPDGFCTNAAFQRGDGSCVIDNSTEQLYYDGNSQGGIMGGALVALAHDIRRGVLGVLGMNYSTLLNRSVDWENSYAFFLYTTYPDKIDEQLCFALMQMLWDRAEANGYALHMTDDPYADPSPADDPFHAAKATASAKGAKQVLLHAALGDHQVANITAEVEARTVGASIIGTSLAESKHWAGANRFFELPPIGTFPADGSAMVYWDNGNNTPPNDNVPPNEVCNDPHEAPRRDPNAIEQKRRFFHDRLVFDTCGGLPCETDHNRNCVDGQPIP